MKTRKPLPQQAMIAIVVSAVLLFGFAAWFLLVHPQSGKVANLKRQATDVQEKIDAYNQQVAAARSAPKIEVADVYRLAKAMPDKTDMPDLLLELSQLARDTGIRFDSISPQPMTAVGVYAVAPAPAAAPAVTPPASGTTTTPTTTTTDSSSTSASATGAP